MRPNAKCRDCGKRFGISSHLLKSRNDRGAPERCSACGGILDEIVTRKERQMQKDRDAVEREREKGE